MSQVCIEKYVTTWPNREPILYVNQLKPLYGLLRLALLFYKKLRKDLADMGFEVNPYNPCVANKMINGSQMTVTWHVDDLKVSHKKSTEVTKFILVLGRIYGNGLSVMRGKRHSYLEIDFVSSSSSLWEIFRLSTCHVAVICDPLIILLATHGS